jgi:hypothetical protein
MERGMKRDYSIKRPSMKTTKKQIVHWCERYINECGYPVDASEMSTRCFRCAYERPTEKAHIVPWANYNYDPKYDSPQYYRLLCSVCHGEAPNVMDEEYMDKWIITSAKEFNSSLQYDTYWLYRHKFEELLVQTQSHGFEPLNAATKEWVNEEMGKFIEGIWKERGLVI